MHTYGVDTNEEASELHGRGINGKIIVIGCLIAAALIAVGMMGALTNAEVDPSYILPEGTPTATPRSTLPWGS